MRTLLATTVLLALAGLTACSGDDDTTAEDPATTASSSTPTPTPTTTPGPGTYPDFAAEDYTYVLELQCYCPLVGPAAITVEDDKVVSAVTTTAAGGVPKGSKAPDLYRQTINDLIARANDPKVDKVEVTWPAGSDHPTVIALDPIRNAVDDEVTYLIRRVEVG